MPSAKTPPRRANAPDAFQNEDYADFNAPDHAWHILGIVLNYARARRICRGLGVAKLASFGEKSAKLRPDELACLDAGAATDS